MIRRLRPKRQRVRASILLDALIGVFIVTMAALSYLSLTVVTHKAQVISKDDSKASQMVARLLEQVQLLTTRDLNTSTLKAMNLVDSNSASSPYSFTNIPLDQGTMYSPSKALPDGKGSLTLTTLSNGSVRAVATVTWRSASGANRSFTSGTIIGAYR